MAPSTLRFKLSQNHTLPALPFSEAVIPMDHASLAGYAASTGEPLVIARPTKMKYGKVPGLDKQASP